MHCKKEKFLTYLDTVSGIEEQTSGRAFDDDVIEKVIVDRVARILKTNEIHVQLPETLFGLSYRVDCGFDLEIPQSEDYHAYALVFDPTQGFDFVENRYKTSARILNLQLDYGHCLVL
ncbi:hypothetical protein GQX74_005941 [Glossina fuscipes]|nr:hypothetical protein GQX74_005941 [Glossina fuscipes]